MLKALLSSWMVLALAAMSTAQNLVPNGGFEDTIDCFTPTQCTLLKAKYWRNPTPSTPDVWDCDLGRVCGYAMDLTDPELIGVQTAYEGERFGGCYLWDGPDAPVREYGMVHLADPLVQGRSYIVSMRYSRADGCMYAIDHFGAWVGPDSLSSTSPYRLEVEPQLRLRSSSSSHLMEQDGWGFISDTLVATGGEEWLVIGNFEADEDVDAIVVDPESTAPSAYYFFDDVSVSLMADVGIGEAMPTAWWDGRQINVAGNHPGRQVDVSLFDMTGRLVMRSTVPVEAYATIPVDTKLLPGPYVARISVGDRFFTVRFIKEERGL